MLRLDGGAVRCDEGEGKDGFDFYILIQESNRGKSLRSEDRKRKKMFTLGHGSFEVPEILDSMILGFNSRFNSRFNPNEIWVNNSGKKGQDNKEL